MPPSPLTGSFPSFLYCFQGRKHHAILLPGSLESLKDFKINNTSKNFSFIACFRSSFLKSRFLSNKQIFEHKLRYRTFLSQPKNCGLQTKMKENRKRRKPPRLEKMNCLRFAYAGTESIIEKYRSRRICTTTDSLLKSHRVHIGVE
jgi:hypothetical protein